jgi:hypothetical protein
MKTIYITMGSGVLLAIGLVQVAQSAAPNKSSDSTIPNAIIRAEDIKRQASGISETSLVSTPARVIGTTTLPRRQQPSERPPIVIGTRSNANDPNGSPTAQLCWHRREIELAIIGELRISDSLQQTDRSLADVTAAFSEWRGLSKLPVALQPFANRLLEDAKKFTAQPDANTSVILTSFDVENYPSAKEYAENAVRDPGCKEP